MGTMINFLIQIVKHVISGWTNDENKKYYMHCMTGHGRTGLISVLLLMCLYRIEWQKALDLLKKYHVNRDCPNGKYFYNSCKSAMRIKAKNMIQRSIHSKNIIQCLRNLHNSNKSKNYKTRCTKYMINM